MKTTKIGLRLLLGGRDAWRAALIVLEAWGRHRTITGTSAELGVSARQLSRWVRAYPELSKIDKALRPDGSTGVRGVAPGQARRGPSEKAPCPDCGALVAVGPNGVHGLHRRVCGRSTRKAAA